MPVEKNRLIQGMPTQARARFISMCDFAELELSQTMYEVGAETRHVYFPVSGFISLVVVMDQRAALEVGMVGSEGMLGVHVALGLRASPLRALVQGPGAAWRMTAARLRKERTDNPYFQRALDRYVAVLMSQLASSAACARFHLIKQRLARWLLMSQDRARADNFHMTHEFLSYMLGVRRVGITVAAVALQNEGLIEYHRGHVAVRNRKGLEAVACSCYASDHAAYASLTR